MTCMLASKQAFHAVHFYHTDASPHTPAKRPEAACQPDETHAALQAQLLKSTSFWVKDVEQLYPDLMAQALGLSKAGLKIPR